MSQLHDELQRILGSGQPIGRIGRAIVDLLEKASDDAEAVKLLAFAAAERDAVEKREISLDAKAPSDETWKRLELSERAELRRFLRESLLESTDAQDFGKRWHAFISKYPSKETRAFLVANVLYSWYLPFQPLPGRPAALSDNARKKALETHREAFEQMHRLAILPFRKTSEMAGLALKVLDSVEDEDARVALLAMLVHRAQTMAGLTAERRAQALAGVGAGPASLAGADGS